MSTPASYTAPRIKLCGLSHPQDIAVANELAPDFIGFVFWPKSKRAVTADEARELKRQLSPAIKAVGVFVDEDPAQVAKLLETNVIDLAQLHGSEDEAYISRLRERTQKPIIQAFRIASPADLARARQSSAEYLLLDSGKGSGETFDWNLLASFERPYFLAGGLNGSNVASAIACLHPFALDVSSGIETAGLKDPQKMRAFVATVRNASPQEFPREDERA